MTPIDKWMESAALGHIARFGAAGASKSNLGEVFMDAPAEVLALDRKGKERLLDRTLRRLVRHGVVTRKQCREPRDRETFRGVRTAHIWVNRYVRVNVLMALALAAAEPHERK